MSAKKTSNEVLQETIDAVQAAGGQRGGAKLLGIPRNTVQSRVDAARLAGLQPRGTAPDDPMLLKRTIKELEAQLRRASTQSADAAAVLAAIGILRDEIGAFKQPRWLDQPSRSYGSPGVPTLFLSDLHWGERVFPRQINGVNRFNLEIARRRLNYTVETTIHLLRILDSKMRYPGIVVPLGGDMISGNIHDELTATNELNTMPTVLDLYGQLIGVIDRLANVFGRVVLPCVTGNHGRDTQKIWAKDRHHTSFDWLLYQFLAKHFEADKRVQFYIPDSNDALFRIYGTKYALTHGDRLGRGGDGLIGFLGPVTRGDNKKRARNAQIDLDYDVLIFGHWHQYAHLTRMIGNGTLKGYDEFASENNFPFERPQQALWITHPEHGITFRMPVYCEPGLGVPTRKWVSLLETNHESR